MEAVVATAEVSVPASTEALATISPTKAAATSGDFNAFERAERATREGKAVDVAAPPVTPKTRAHSGAPPKVEAAAPPVEAAPVETKLTREQKEQARINETIQRGIEAATAPLKAELERLRPAAPVVEKPATVPDYKRIMGLPGAPKLSKFDSVEEHNFAAAAFVNQTLTAERTADADHAAQTADLESVYVKKIEGFVGQLTKAKADDPTFPTKLSQEVKALQPGVTQGPQSVVAVQLYDSPVAPAVALELSKPGVLAALIAMPPAIAAIRDQRQREWLHRQHIEREFNRLEGRLLVSTDDTAAPAPVESPRSPISTAPAPAAIITRAKSTSDPKAAAINSNNFAAFDKIERDTEAARRRERAGA